MSVFEIEASDRSPKVLIDRERGRIELEGESYPENVVDFFAPVLGELRAFLKEAEDKEIVAIFKLRYFNSSSAKVIFNIIDLLDGAAQSNRIIVKWFADPDDDVMIEFGEDLQEDVDAAQFDIVSA